MALRKQPVAIPFGGGVETRQDPKQVPPVKLLDLQNAVFTRESTLSKRNGYEALAKTIEGGASEYTDAQALATRGDELLLFADGRAYSHRPDADRWSDTGACIAAVASDAPLARTGTNQSVPDIATLSGVSLVAWEDSRGGVWWSTVEASTGRILRAAAQMSATGTRPRCVTCGTVLALLWAEAASGQLWVAIVNPATPTAAATTAVLSGDLLAATPDYDAVAETYYGYAVLAWPATTGLRVGYLHPSGVLGSPVTGLPSVVTLAAVVGPTAIADAEGTLVVVASDGATSLRWYTLFGAGTLTVTSTDTVAVGGIPERLAAAWNYGDQSCAFAEMAGATPNLNYTLSLYRVGSASFVTDTLRGHGLLSRAWTDGTAAGVYVTVGHAVEHFPYAAVVRGGSAAGWGEVVARLLPGVLPGLPGRGMVASVQADADDARRWSFPLLDRLALSTEDEDEYGEVGIRRVSLDFAADAAYQTAQLGRGLYLSAAAPQHYDGSRWAEWGFHTAPDDGMAGVAGSGGGLSVSSAYSYLAWYEETDAQGEVHQGGTSIPLVVSTGGGDNRITLTLPTLRLTARSRVRIVVARCKANDPTVFYLVTSTDPSDTTGSNRYVDNDPTVDTVTLVDDLSDVLLAARPLAYTNGGTLSNDPSPCAGAIIAGGKNRLFWTDPSDPHTVRYSQQLLDGNAVECPPELALQVDPYGGAITGLAVLDDVVVVFKESAIYVFGGPGPLANPDISGDQYAFTPAQLVTSDAGCLSQDSIGYTPVGLLFQSSKGILLLDRSRQLVRIGDPVEGYDAQTVRAATLLPDRTHVLLVSDAADGRALLYDYERGQWSTFTNHVGVDGVVVDGVYHYLRSDGRVFRETPGAYADDNAQIRMVIDTAWVKLAGYLQGWQRIYHASFLGRYISPHTLRVSWRLDYEDGWREPQSLDVDADWNPSVYGEGLFGAGYYGGIATGSTVYQRRIHIGRRCQSIRFRLEDVEATDARGASFELSELLLTGGILAPAFKLSAARSD